ncbi:hypothetical protein ACWCXE_02525 [Streptomyces sp. NPDC001780]
MTSNPFRPGTGRHRLPGKGTRLARTSATRVCVAAAAGVLYGGGAAQAADAAQPAEAAPTAPAPSAPVPSTPAPAPSAAVSSAAEEEPDEPDDPPPPGNRHRGLIVIDNSSADSWLEVDRTLNTLIGSRGTAGSDHDGGGGAIDVHAGDVRDSGGPVASGGSCPCPDTTTPSPAPRSSPLGWITQLGHPPWQGEGSE